MVKKNKIILLIVVLILVSIVLVGCSKEGDVTTSEPILFVNEDVFGYLGKTSKEMEDIFGEYEHMGEFDGAEWFKYGEYVVSYENTMSVPPEGKVIVVASLLKNLIGEMEESLSIEELNSLFGVAGKTDFVVMDIGAERTYHVDYELKDVIIRIWLGKNKTFVESDSQFIIRKND